MAHRIPPLRLARPSPGGLWLALAAALLVLPAAATAQEPENPAVTEARALVDAGDFGAAAARLRQHLANYPSDGAATRLFARTLYWMGESREADRVYSRALAARPDDHGLRLAYGRFLLDTGAWSEAERIVQPLAAGRADVPPETTADARALLGTVAYWSGDLTDAKHRFESALRLQPGHPDATRQLAEIRARTAPWLRLGADVSDDDQPLTAVQGEVEVGSYLTPLTTVSVVVTPTSLDADSVDTTVFDARGVIRTSWPRSRVEAEISAGVTTRSEPSDTEVIGGASIGFRLRPDVVLKAGGERRMYTSTAGSLSRPQLVESFEAALDASDAPGWAGKAGVKIDRFPDDNTVTSAYGWILAPLLRHARGSLRAGYAFQVQDSDETTFNTDGVYDRYYTPEAFTAHSVVVAAAVELSPRAWLTVDGAAAFAAQEDAPEVVIAEPQDPGSPQFRAVLFSERDFTPWRARATLAAQVSPRVTLRLAAEHSRSAFFEITHESFGLDIRFLP